MRRGQRHAYNQTSYFYARFYEAETGTWLTQDTYRGELNAPDTLHRYGYVTQSPVDYWDWYGWCIAINDDEVLPPWIGPYLEYEYVIDPFDPWFETDLLALDVPLTNDVVTKGVDLSNRDIYEFAQYWFYTYNEHPNLCVIKCCEGMFTWPELR